MRILAQADGHEDFWPAYTDILMITCLVLMLLAATFALSRQDDRIKKERERRMAAFEQLFKKAMAPELSTGLVHFSSPKDSDKQTISFSDQLLFEVGDATLKRPAGKKSLEKLTRLFQPSLKDDGMFQKIQVNGHTDPDPIKTKAFPSNWHLSSARATSVVYFFVQRGLPPERLTATGFAQYHPLEPNGEKIGSKARMRRIEVVLLYPSEWIKRQIQQASREQSAS